MFKAKPFVVSSSWGNVIAKPNKLSFRDFANKVHTKDKGFFDLAEFQFEIAEWALNQKGTSLLLATRGIGKSNIITCLTALYRIYCNPRASVLILSDTATKSKDLLKYIRIIILNNMDFFSDIFSPSGLLIEFLNTKQNATKEHSLYTGSLGGTLRGKHPNYIIMDDILTMETSNSSVRRKDVETFYDEAKKLTKDVLLIGNATHPDDLYQTLRHSKAVSVYEIYNDNEKIPDFLKVDTEKERDEGVSEASIMANYYGVLIPDETLPFYDVTVGNLDAVPKNITQYNIFYDFSHGKNDSNALSIAFIYNMKCYIIGLCKVCPWSDFIELTAPILRELSINKVFYEDNTTGNEPDKLFVKYGIASFGSHTTTNKKSKIARLYPYRKDIILLDIGSNENRDFLKQVKSYSPADNNIKDDAVDSIAMNLIKMGYIK